MAIWIFVILPEATNMDTTPPNVRQSARRIDQCAADHATRHRGDGIDGSEEERWVKIDVEVIVPPMNETARIRSSTETADLQT